MSESSSINILNPTKDVHKALGEMVVQFQEVENALKWLGCALLNSSESKPDMIVLSLLSFRDLVNVIEALAAYRFRDGASLLDTHAAVIKRCRCANDRRNQLIHSNWSRAIDGVGARRRKQGLKNGILTTSEEILSIYSLRDFNELLEVLFTEVVALMEDAGLVPVLAEAEKGLE